MKTQLNELALFAGAGGGILGGKLLGWRTVCAVEWDSYARDVLVARQNDGCLEAFPIWDDVQTFDGKPWRGLIDVVSGGFPCQDISAAGKGAGIEGERSSMWKHMARIIGEVQPKYAFVENSPMLVGRGLSTVLADLAEMGYDAKWGIMGAHHVSAPHKRDRIWIVAKRSRQFSHSKHDRTRWREQQSQSVEEKARDVADTKSWKSRQQAEWQMRQNTIGGNSDCGGDLHEGAEVCHAAGTRLEITSRKSRPLEQSRSQSESERSDWWATEPDVGRVAHGVAARVDRLRCIGNGQVSAVAKLAWNTLKQ